MLCVGMDGMGWVVIICHRSSKSTFGANAIEKKIIFSKIPKGRVAPLKRINFQNIPKEGGG